MSGTYDPSGPQNALMRRMFRRQPPQPEPQQSRPAFQPPAELSGQRQADFQQPGNMPTGPIAEDPAIAGPNPYAPPVAPVAPRMPIVGRNAMREAEPPGGADELNRIVQALMQGQDAQGADPATVARLRERMQLAEVPQAGGLY